MDAVSNRLPARDPGSDPVLVRREQIRRAATGAQRVGLLLLVAFLLLSLVGLFGDFPDAVVTGMTVCLVGGSLVLAPAILVLYMVKAADRDDRERGL
jgi:hypothetical protein